MQRAPERPVQEERGAYSRTAAVDLRGVVSTLSTGERLISGASLLLLAALFLDWISVSCSGAFCGFGSTGGGGGMHGWGWLTVFGLLGAAGVLVGGRLLTGRVTIPELPASDAALYMAMGGVEMAGCLLFWLEYHGAFISDGPVSVGLGVGWPLAIVAGVVTVAGGFLMRTREVGSRREPGVAVPPTTR
jgi:hypothetical protein